MLLKETLLLRAIGLARIPFLLALRPRVERLDDEGADVVVPLGYFTRNHIGAMYVGALAAGADCAAGLCAVRSILGLRGASAHRRVVPLFKSLRAEFHRRADGDVRFSCDDGRGVREAVERADRDGERVTLPVRVAAHLAARHGDAPVATFELELSLKRKE